MPLQKPKPPSKPKTLSPKPPSTPPPGIYAKESEDQVHESMRTLGTPKEQRDNCAVDMLSKLGQAPPMTACLNEMTAWRHQPHTSPHPHPGSPAPRLR